MGKILVWGAGVPPPVRAVNAKLTQHKALPYPHVIYFKRAVAAKENCGSAAENKTSTVNYLDVTELKYNSVITPETLKDVLNELPL